MHPYPYRASIAICSDLDETANAAAYFNTSEFLNTDVQTAFGKGVNLEVGNTLYFLMPNGEFSYFGAEKSEQARLRALMKSGHIDCLHSFGDDATDRSHALRAINHLLDHGCQVPVWIDHAEAPTNFGSDIMRGLGDIRGSAAYHADISFKLGIKFIWLGRVTSFVGQDVRCSILDGIRAKSPPYRSTTILKSVVKGMLGKIGYSKYRMHDGNHLTRPVALRDGTRTIEFIRCNPHPAGVSCGDNAAGIAATLSSAVIDRLISRGGRMILYTHLGKMLRNEGFPSDAEDALRGLSARYRDGEILVTTTSRLLRYSQMLKTIQWEVIDDGDVSTISVSTDGDNDHVEGLAFEVSDRRTFKISVDGHFVDAEVQGVLSSGRCVLGIPWKKLQYLSSRIH